MLADTSFLVDLMDQLPKAVARAKALDRAAVRARIPAPALFELWRSVHLAARSEPEARRVQGLLAASPRLPSTRTPPRGRARSTRS